MMLSYSSEVVHIAVYMVCTSARDIWRLHLLAPLRTSSTQAADSESGGGVKMVACGTAHTAVVTEAGELLTWGKHDDGRLG